MNGRSLKELYERGDLKDHQLTEENLICLFEYEIKQIEALGIDNYSMDAYYFCADKLAGYDSGDSELSRKTRQTIIKESKKIYRKGEPVRFIRYMARASVAACLAFCFFISVNVATGKNLFDFLFDWQKDMLELSVDKNTDSILNVGDNQQMPAWVPEGYSLSKVYKKKLDNRTILYYFYTDKNENLFIIDIQNFNNPVKFAVEIKDGEETVYTYKNREFHLSENAGRSNITWVDENIIYSIYGNISKVSIKTIAESYYGGKYE